MTLWLPTGSNAHACLPKVVTDEYLLSLLARAQRELSEVAKEPRKPSLRAISLRSRGMCAINSARRSTLTNRLSGFSRFFSLT